MSRDMPEALMTLVIVGWAAAIGILISWWLPLALLLITASVLLVFWAVYS